MHQDNWRKRYFIQKTRGHFNSFSREGRIGSCGGHVLCYTSGKGSVSLSMSEVLYERWVTKMFKYS